MLDRATVFEDFSPGPGFEVSRAAACDGAWTLRSFDPGPGYVGALAVQCSDWRLVRFDWASSTFGTKPR